jgi:CRP-like cAMP-binding protein
MTATKNQDSISLRDARSFLSRTGWLSRTPTDFCNRVLANCRLMTFDSDQSVYTVGDPPGGLYGLVRGRVAITIAPQERGPYFAHAMRPGNWFGMASTLNNGRRGIGLRTTRPSQLLLLPAIEFERITKETPTAWRQLAMLAFIISDLSMCSADDLMIRDPEKRCLAVLARLAGLRHSVDDSPETEDIDITQDEFSHLANLSRNAIGTYLRRFEQEGHIKLGYKNISVLNRDAILASLTDC